MDEKPTANGSSLAQEPSTSQNEVSDDHNGRETAHDSDDEPMNFTTPRDYATWARETRARALADGADPTMVILQSEVKNYVTPRAEGESAGDYTKRYVDVMNDMIRRGVQILNDSSTADVKPNGFGLREGVYFDLSTATKREYREFNEWWSEQTRGTRSQVTIPERFVKFQREDWVR